MNNTNNTIKLKISSKFKIYDRVIFKNKLDDPNYIEFGFNSTYFVRGIRFIQEVTSSTLETNKITQAIEYLLTVSSDIDILDGTPLNRNGLLYASQDLLKNAELTLEELKELGNQFHAILTKKHYWIWRKDVTNLIDYLKNNLPNPTNKEIYDRVGQNFVDWEAQTIKDNKDWYEALDEIARDRDLLPHEKQQLENHISF